MESQNQQILELLGFSGGEHFDSAKALVEDTSADWEAFHKTIPFPLLVAAKDLLFHALTQGVADHSADLASKIDAGDCAKPPTKAVKDWIAETRMH